MQIKQTKEQVLDNGIKRYYTGITIKNIDPFISGWNTSSYIGPFSSKEQFLIDFDDRYHLIPNAMSYKITFNILLIDPLQEDINIGRHNLLIDMSDLNNNLNKREQKITLDYFDHNVLDFST